MPDHNTIWISGWNGVVMKTLDGGTNWTLYDTNFFHCGDHKNNKWRRHMGVKRYMQN